MDIAENKVVLFGIVKEADEKLTRLLIALANEYNDSSIEFTKEEIEDFRKIRDKLLQHPETGSTVEEVHERIRRNYHDRV